MKILDFKDFGWIPILLAFQEAIKKNSKMINEWPIEWYLELDNLKLDNLKLSLEKEMFWTSSRKRIFQPFEKFDSYSSFLKEHLNSFKQSTEALNYVAAETLKNVTEPFKIVAESLNNYNKQIAEPFKIVAESLKQLQQTVHRSF